MPYVNPQASFEQMLAEAVAALDGGGPLPPKNAMLAGVLAREQAGNQMRPGQPEMRNANTSFGDRVAGWFGTQAGPMASGIDRGLQSARPVAQEFTGIPAMQRGAGNVGRGISEGDPLRVAGGVVEAGAGLLPYGPARAAALYSTVPRAVGTSAAIAAAPVVAESGGSVVPTAQAAGVDPVALQKRLRGMTAEDIRAYQAQIGMPEKQQDGRPGPTTDAAALAYETRQAIAAEGDNKAKQEQARIAAQGEADAKREAARIAAEADAKARLARSAAELARDNKKKAKATPFRDLYPEIMPWVPVATTAVAAGAGALTRGSFGRQFNNELADLSARWAKAVKTGNAALAGEIQQTVNAMRAAGPGGTGTALVTGGAVGGVGALLPEEIDVARGVPGSAERFADPDTLKRLGFGVGFGAGAAHLGAEGAAALQRRVHHPTFGPETNAMLRGPQGPGPQGQPGGQSLPPGPTTGPTGRQPGGPQGFSPQGSRPQILGPGSGGVGGGTSTGSVQQASRFPSATDIERQTAVNWARLNHKKIPPEVLSILVAAGVISQTDLEQPVN